MLGRPAIHLVAEAPEPRETPVLLTDATTTPTQAQRIAGERLAMAAARLGRITGASFMTPDARAQAVALRRDVERLCGELRRAGL